MKKYSRYLIVSGYVSISAGRTRATEDVDVLLDQAEKRIFGIAQKSLTQNFLPVKDTLEEAFERIDQLSKKELV